MIKNIIFDLGGVLFKGGTINELFSKLFNMPLKQAINFMDDYFQYYKDSKLSKQFWKQLRQQINYKDSWQMMRLYFLNSMLINKDVNEIISKLRFKGLKVYYLSNSHIDIHPFLEDKYGYTKLFHGGILSHTINYYKPQPNIYFAFLMRFGLNPKECMFIDDLKINLLTAEKLGFTVHHFKNSAMLRKALNI